MASFKWSVICFTADKSYTYSESAVRKTHCSASTSWVLATKSHRKFNKSWVDFETCHCSFLTFITILTAAIFQHKVLKDRRQPLRLRKWFNGYSWTFLWTLIVLKEWIFNGLYLSGLYSFTSAIKNETTRITRYSLRVSCSECPNGKFQQWTVEF